MIEGVVLDLDDTLYLERDFVRSGFRSVAENMSELGVAEADAVFSHLWQEFEAGRRGDAFDSLSSRFPFEGRASVAILVDHYRNHRPDIEVLEPEALSAISQSGAALGLISDGYPATQAAKIDALGIRDLFEVVVLTGEWGREFWKPHPRAFEFVESEFEMAGHQLAYVADNPTKDFVVPNRRGWLSVRLRVPGQLHHAVEVDDLEARPQTEISSLTELAPMLPSQSERRS